MPPRGRHVIAWAKSHGCSWHEDKGKGSHGLLRREGRRAYTVSTRMMREMPWAVIEALCRQLGLPLDEVERELGRPGR